MRQLARCFSQIHNLHWVVTWKLQHIPLPCRLLTAYDCYSDGQGPTTSSIALSLDGNYFEPLTQPTDLQPASHCKVYLVSVLIKADEGGFLPLGLLSWSNTS